MVHRDQVGFYTPAGYGMTDELVAGDIAWVYTLMDQGKQLAFFPIEITLQTRMIRRSHALFFVTLPTDDLEKMQLLSS